MAGRRDGVLPLLLRQRQQTFRRDTLVRHHAEEPARRYAGIVRKHLQTATGREVLPRLPGIDRGNRNAQIRGDLLQWDAFLEPPVAERRRKGSVDVAMEFLLLGHSGSLRGIRGVSNGLMVADETCHSELARNLKFPTRKDARDCRSGVSSDSAPSLRSE